MAIMHTKTNSLIEKRNEIKQKKRKYSLILLSNFLFFISLTISEFMLMNFLQVFVIYFLVTAPFSYYKWYNLNSESKKYKFGIVGEDYALNILDGLNNSYHVFNDIYVTYEGKSSQLDTVIVGDNGVFVMEVKNIKGEIEGNIEDKNLRIKKVGQQGGVL